MFALAADVQTARLAGVGADAERDDLVDHFGEDGDQVAVAEGEHRIQVHGGARLGQAGDDHALGRALGEQGLSHLTDGLA
ncbi:hypothetical protein D3C86_1882950 [compost metagenome]